MHLSELFKVIIIGIVEGVTEWLPISSTGHMIIVNEFVRLDVSDEFFEMFIVVIQLGAICAVPTVFHNKIFPFCKSKEERGAVYELWKKVLIGIVPAVVIGLFFEIMNVDSYVNNHIIVAITLIAYGIVFLILPKIIRGRNDNILKTELTAGDALRVGLCQTLSLIPGTSRSGATMIGGMLLGYDVVLSAEFSFFMAIPVMLGASVLKVVGFVFSGFVLTPKEIFVLIIGTLVSYAVSIVSIRFLLDFVKHRGLSAFGIYRIILGVIVIVIFLIKKYG